MVIDVDGHDESRARAGARFGDGGRARICLVTSEYPPDQGGLGKSAQRIARGLAATGVDVHVFKPARDGKRKGPTRGPDGVVLCEADIDMRLRRAPPIGRPPLPRIGLHEHSPDLEAAVAHADADASFQLFHGFGLWVAPACASLAHRRRKPLVLSIRGADGVFLRRFPAWIEALRSAARVTSVSKDSLERAAMLANLDGRGSFIPNGIERSGALRWQPTATNAGVVGSVAVFRTKKNIPLLVEAYALLPKKLRRKLLLVGNFLTSSPEHRAHKAATDAAIRRNLLGAEVELTGFVESAQVAEHLVRQRVFALSSSHEGLPNSVLEAAAAGVPIVTTAVDGLKDVFQHGTSALLVTPGDARAMSEAIRRVLENDALAWSLSEGALAVASRLSVQAEVQAYWTLYQELLGASSTERTTS